MEKSLCHFDEQGASRMVEVGHKPVSERVAEASGVVRMAAETHGRITDRTLKKGDVLEVARLAGIMAAKRTSELIPLCHQLPLDGVSIDYEFPNNETIKIVCQVKVTAKTGVEMEALTAVSVTALTIYDMCKGIDRGMSIEQVRLEKKSGGKSGEWSRQRAEGRGQ